MQHSGLKPERGDGFYSLSARDLKDLYLGTVSELKVCAEFVPSGIDGDADMDDREAILLDFEARVLNQLAEVTLRSEKDVKTLIEVWNLVSDSRDPLESSAADRLSMKILKAI